MILTDLLGGNLYPSQDQIDNCKKLIKVVNSFEDLLGIEFTCTSGLRSMEAHVAIYKRLQAQDIANKRTPRPIPLKSAHLSGSACDFISKTFAITDLQGFFLLPDVQRLAEEQGAYFEDWRWLKKNGFRSDWVHIQNISPASGLRMFRPF